MKRRSTYLLAILLIFLCISCDRATKNMATASLRGNPPVVLAGGMVMLTYAENSGAMLGIGASLSDSARFWILTVGVGLLLAVLLAYLLFSRGLTPPLVAATTLMLGGGLSNFCDRLIHNGRVVDFVTLGVGTLRTGVFNAADVEITMGVALFLVTTLRTGRQHSR